MPSSADLSFLSWSFLFCFSLCIPEGDGRERNVEQLQRLFLRMDFLLRVVFWEVNGGDRGHG